jgi:hypothetical protein
LSCKKLVEAGTDIAFFLVRGQAEATMAELEEKLEKIILGMSCFFVQHHQCEQVTWWLSLVKQTLSTTYRFFEYIED